MIQPDGNAYDICVTYNCRWMTEKYDGVRLYWNGFAFYTRQGKYVQVPRSIRLRMPKNIALDGELW
jgi:DNA ligase-1